VPGLGTAGESDVRFIAWMLLMFFLWVLAWALYVFWNIVNTVVAGVRAILALVGNRGTTGHEGYRMRSKISFVFNEKDPVKFKESSREKGG
jgi:hypothetical protein